MALNDDTLNPNIGLDTYDLLDNYYYYLSRDEGQYGDAAEYARQFFKYYKQLYDEVYDAVSRGKTTISREGKYEPYPDNSTFAGQTNAYFDALFGGEQEIDIDTLVNNPNFDAGASAYNRAGYIFEWATWPTISNGANLLDRANTAYQETISTPLGRQILKAQDYIDQLQENLSPTISKDRAVLAGAEAVLDSVSDLVNSDFGRTAQGATLKAAGDMLQGLSGAVVLIDKNPADTAMHQLGRELLQLGNDTYSPEFQAALSDIEDRISKAQGAQETAAAIYGSLKDHPTEFLVDYVGTEVIQELGPLAVAKTAGRVARTVSEVLEVTKEVSDKIVRNTELVGGIATDLAESMFGSAAGAYEEALNDLLSKGVINPDTGQPYTQEEAESAAFDIATRNSVVAGIATAVSMGLGGRALENFLDKKFPDVDLNPEEAMDKWLEAVGDAVNVGRGAMDTFKDYAKELGERALDIAKVAGQEGVSEGIEELIVSADLELQLYERGSVDRDVSGNLAASTILGTLAGAGTGGGVATAGSLANVLRTANPQINEIMLEADVAVANGADPQLIANQTQQTLQQIGLDQPSIQNELLNEVYDQGYLTESEVYQTAARLGIELLPEQLGDYAGQTDELAHMEDLINDLQQNIYGAPFEAEFDVDNDGQLDQYERKEYDEAMEAWEESNPFYDELLGEGAGTEGEGTPDLIFVPEGTSIEELTGPGGPYEGWEIEESIIAESGDFIKNPNATGTQPPSIGDFDIDNDGSLSPSELVIFDAARRIFTQIYNEAADQLGQAAQSGADEGEEPPAGTDQTGTDTTGTGTTGTGTDTTGTDTTGTDPGGNIDIPDEIFVEGDQNDYLRVGQYNDGVENLYTQIVKEMLRLESEGKTRDEAIAQAIGVAADENGNPTGLYKEIAKLATQDQVNQVLQAIGSKVDPETGGPTGLYAVIADLPSQDDLTALETSILQQVSDLLYGPNAQEGMTIEEAIKQVMGEEVGPDGNPTGIFADIAALPTSDEVKRIVEDAIGAPAVGDTPATGIFENIYSKAELNLKFETERAEILAGVKALLGTDPDITVQEAIERIVGVPSDDDGNPTGLYELIAGINTEIFGEEGLASVINQIKTDMLTDGDLANLVTKEQLDIALGNPTTYNADGTIKTEGTGVFETLATRQDLQNLKSQTIQEIKDLLGTGELTVDEAIKQVVGVEKDENGNPTGLYDAISKLPTAASVDAIKGVVDDIKKDMLTDDDLANLVTKDQLDAAIGTPTTYNDDGTIATEGTGVFRTVATRQDLQNLKTETIKEIKDLLGTGDLTVEQAIQQIVGVEKDENGNPTGLYDKISKLPTTVDIDAIKSVVDGIATELGTTADEVAEIKTYLETNLGTPTQYDEDGNVISEATGVYTVIEGLATKVDLANVEAAILKEVRDNETAGLKRDEALQKAVQKVADDLGISVEELSGQIGTPTEYDEEGNVVSEATGLYITLEGLATKVDLSNVEEAILKEVRANEDAGQARDEALDNAIKKVAEDLGTTAENIKNQIGTPTEYDEDGNVVSEATGIYITLEGLATRKQVADVENAVLDKLAEYEAAGLTRDEALQKAIDDVAADLNTTKDEITTQLTAFETSLSAELATLATKTQVSDLELSLYEKMAEYEALGLARDEATQKALADLSTELGITEDNLLTQINTTEDALTERINEVETNLQTEIETATKTITDTVTDTATQTQADIETAARQSAARDWVDLLLGSEDLFGQQVTVNQSPLADIRYFYGFESPFATPQQAGYYGSAGPYGAPLAASRQQVAQQRGLGSIMQGPLNLGQPMGRPPGMAAGGKVDYDFLDEISQIMSFGD